MGPLSYEFETADRTRTLWDAGYHSGHLYVALAQGAGEMLRLPTGLTPNELGGCDVDLETFQAFTQGMYDSYCSTTSFIMHDLMRGLLLASIVMLEKGGGTIVRVPEREAGLLQKHDTYVRGMWVED
ncbi:hypothetical protein CLM62_05175 [Streptomyces sp. SA15]|uniref:DUF6086 family protein n=1 Tax=Streptomyces sp. SA15 TaxID=934019 RepID=UPI000BAFA0BD|nr:DUF6086 family protein [Streptomyces sp. SA15]PAZ16964.1 hypothetical protein CLM62_05175 [Streptomyces sp. SA15]